MKFLLRPGEKLIVNDPHALWQMMEMKTIAGQLKLTNERIVFIRNPHPYAVFVLFLVRSMRSGVEFEYRRSSLKAVTSVVFGKEKRLVIDPGSERPKTIITAKAETIEKEFSKLTDPSL